MFRVEGYIHISYQTRSLDSQHLGELGGKLARSQVLGKA